MDRTAATIQLNLRPDTSISVVIEGGRRQLRSTACAVLVLLSPLNALADLAGTWIGHITADRASMLAKTKSPEHHKLLSYALTRVESADVTLNLLPNHTFRWKFDDHYPPDVRTLEGQWSTSKGGLMLAVQKVNNSTKPNPETRFIKLGPNGKVTSPSPLFLMPKGFSVTYSRKG